MDQALRMRMIASVTRLDQMKLVVNSTIKRVNLLTGNIMNLGEIIEQLQHADKQVYVHLEMVAGLGRDHASVQYLATNFKVEGIITTKSNAVYAAHKAGIRSIQRFFAIDTAAVKSGLKQIEQHQPDEVELMPGLMPRIISEVKGRINQPLIAGGMIHSKEEIEMALISGADFVSIGSDHLWGDK